MTEIRAGLAYLGVALAAFAAATAPAAAAVEIAPHRAVYELTLDPTKASSKVDKAGGRIAFEITGNACTGYSMTLRQVTRLDTGEGRETVSDLRSITWEDGAAKSYRFKTENYINQELREEVDGTAERVRDGGLAVRLAKPKTDSFPLGGPLLLPTEHLRNLIAGGAADKRLLETRVFDGAPDGRKVYETLAIIGTPVTGGTGLEEPVMKPELQSVRRFPITVSYFEAGIGERTPAYVLGFELYENGISRALRLDYGGFALRGELTSLELLKPVPCQR